MQTPTQSPMRAIAVAVAAMLALSGCPGIPVYEDADGVACDHSEGATAVWIDVDTAGSDVKVSDEQCHVDPEARITWRGPVGSSEVFKLRFDGASPGAREPVVVPSTEMGGRQKVEIVANNASGEYRYDVVTPDGGIDPAIIIRAR